MSPALKMPSLKFRSRKTTKIKFRSDCELPYYKDKEPWYLRKYIEESKRRYGEPEVVEKPATTYKFKRKYNVIYPVDGGIFINALSERTKSGYPQYIVIEPPRPPERVLSIAEEEIAALIPEGVVPPSPQEKACLMLDLAKMALPKILGRVGPLLRDGIPPSEMGKVLIYHVIRDKISVGVLEPFIRDPFLEDISCSGLGNIYIIHKVFGPMESSVGFKDEASLNSFIISLAEKIGKPISNARPIVDATLPDGSRINIVYGSDVSLRGSNFTIRKVSKTPLSITQLINWGTFDSRIAAYVWMLLREGMSGFVCGETASGKTTSLTAMLAFIRPSAKIVSIEDTAEVVVPHPNWTRELTRDTGKKESSVTMFDLLRAALRQRPNYIIVGEIRGAEGNIAFQAMQSVSWDTPIMIKDLKSGKIELRKIGEVVDKYYEEDEEGVPKKANDFLVLSMNRQGKIVWSPIEYVLRHKATKIYGIRYEGGGFIKATGSHSVFVWDPVAQRVHPKLVTQLKEGDLLITFVNGNPEEIPDGLTFLREIIDECRPYGKECDLKLVGDSYMKLQWLLRLSGLTPVVIKLLREKNGIRVRLKIVKGKKDLLNPLTVKVGKAENAGILRWLHNTDIQVLKVTSVQKLSYNGYVYDVSIPQTELFIGGEVPIALHNTGHPVLSTFHAADIDKLVQRLTNEPINVPKTNIDSLNFAWFQSAVYTKQGFLARRVIRVYEIIGYDASSDSILSMPVFNWDPTTDRFIFTGRGASYLLEEKIAVMKGIPRKQIKQIYDELDLRADYLKELVNRKIFNYWDAWRAVIKADELGIEAALRKLRQGTLL